MVDRIKKIMDEEGMSPGRFAAEIGIKNSRMSHYLSERNNVSLELVTRILERFRGINPEWLLFGRGEMYKTGEVKVGNREPDLFSVQHAQQDLSLNANKADNLYNNTTDTDFFEPEQLKTEENEVSDPIQLPENQNIEATKIAHKTHHEIEKIIVMYSDSTFDCYSPNGHKV